MSNPQQGAVPKGAVPSNDDEDWIKLGYEKKRLSLARLDDTGKLLLTLPATLSTLYLALLGAMSLSKKVIVTDWEAAPVGVWMLAALFALWELLPRSYRVSANSPTDIKNEHEKTLRCKLWKLWFSGLFLIIGIAFAALTVLALVKNNTPDTTPAPPAKQAALELYCSCT